MKGLKSITMAGQTVTIVSKDLSEANWWGYWDAENLEIGIQKDVSAKRFREILRHEMEHAAKYFCGLDCLENGPEEESQIACYERIFWPSWERVERRLGE